MSIERELKEAIENLVFTELNAIMVKEAEQQALKLEDVSKRITTALLPLFAKYAVSLVEVDEGKVENILRDKLAEYDGNMETIPKDWEEKVARTLATSQIIKGKEGR